MPFLLVVATSVLCSPGVRHLRACSRDKLLLLSGTPIPARLCQRELLRAAGVLDFASALLEFLLLWLEFVPGRSWWRFVAPCIASNGLRIHGWQHDLRGSLAGVREVARSPTGSECELRESAAVVARCACCERGCCFARAAVGFVLGLRICVGVSRSLREPTCGVVFTGAGLWSAKPVEGVLALLAAPFSLGCVLVGCPLVVGMLVCCVAPLVERCDTWLWLLSALCWLVVNSGEVLPEFFSVGSGGGELLPHAFDSTGSAGVIFGLTRVVVEAFLSFRYFVVLCGRDSLSQEFVTGRSWWRFVVPCIASSVSALVA
ncbi:hypothetical protein Taro_034034 [Colocasia esculenta]|uniref:Uncharacterized protein n=1 Tax=Colocasia esculenta TaxID=4460 RepID=A0A843W6E9_COLES|nr:hypothetical protein [Colocasia esculenta]